MANIPQHTAKVNAPSAAPFWGPKISLTWLPDDFLNGDAYWIRRRVSRRKHYVARTVWRVSILNTLQLGIGKGAAESRMYSQPGWKNAIAWRKWLPELAPLGLKSQAQRLWNLSNMNTQSSASHRAPQEYLGSDQNSFIRERPFFANKNVTFAKLSRTPCLSFAGSIQQHLLWRFVHNLPNYARESRVTLDSLFKHAASITESLLRADCCWLGFFARFPGPPPPTCTLIFAHSFA